MLVDAGLIAYVELHDDPFEFRTMAKRKKEKRVLYVSLLTGLSVSPSST